MTLCYIKVKTQDVVDIAKSYFVAFVDDVDVMDVVDVSRKVRKSLTRGETVGMAISLY